MKRLVPALRGGDSETVHADPEDDTEDWIDETEENMTDKEEVIERTWQFKTLQVIDSFGIFGHFRVRI